MVFATAAFFTWFYIAKEYRESMEQYFRVGVITSPHGVRGEMKVYPTTDDVSRFKKGMQVILDTKKAQVPHQVENVKFFKNMVILKLDGINSMNDAELLRQCDLLVTRENAVPLEEGEYYLADLLDMTVEEALPFFEAVPSIRRKIETLYDVGLSYVKLGQPSTTLSGGEAQRIKLATELSRRSTGNTIYILDEPTTGLHFADVHKLIEIIHRLAEGGNTVVVIEHNLDVIKTADYIIDMGPEGGDRGGTVVACGTPEEIAACDASYTGQYLKKYLK